LRTINLRIVSGRNITRPPTLTREIFLRWTQFLSVHWEMPRIFAACGMLRSGSRSSSNGAGAGSADLGRVAMDVVFLAEPQVRPPVAFSRAFCHASRKGHESTVGLVRESYLKRKRIPVKRASQRLLNSRLSKAARDGNPLCVNDLTVSHNPATETVGVSPPKLRSAKRILKGNRKMFFPLCQRARPLRKSHHPV